jgi:hypothetical protein
MATEKAVVFVGPQPGEMMVMTTRKMMMMVMLSFWRVLKLDVVVM